MLVRTALARLRAGATRSSARDVAHISRQLAHTYLASSSATTHLAIAPAVQSLRAYATATRTKSKPKAKAATKKKSAAKKTATRKTAAKKPVKKTAAKRTAAKRTVRRTVKRKKVAAKKPAPKRRGLTERQKMLKEKAKTRAEIVQLKKTALEEPKRLASTAWQLYVGEAFRDTTTGDRTAPEVVKKAAQSFKNISSSDVERLQKLADENTRRNNEKYAEWLGSLSPQQILDANKARASLKRKLAVYRKNKIQDGRLVKGPRSAYINFFIEHYTGGDSTELSIAERAKKAGQEWKALPASQKQKYEDAARKDMQRYSSEYKKVYGEEPPRRKAPKAS